MENPNTETPSSSSSTATQPTPAPFVLTSPSMRKSSASKLDYLYEMVYRVQNHALDLALPGTTEALMITTNSQNAPMCTQIPKQIPTEELKKLLPDSWVTNYEKLHQSHVAVQSSDATFTTDKDGSTLITFNKPEEAPSSCIKDSHQDDSQVRPKKISSCKKLRQQLREGHKNIGFLGQPSGKFDYIVKYTPPPRTTEPIVPIGCDDDPDDHLRKPPPPPPSPPTVPPVLPCYKQAQKYLQRQ
ncbi:hypothetical protein TIFTF001_029278 [Ficus carica]|uniref:Uncharacterized protein n=1 Tax=Ficus carica TaxID=3494 RepID=A0AA88DRJ0_FICCA|nr:hypothetical protein TIFTF001_029278 [Ficus carica]